APTEPPPFAVPSVLLSTGASRSAKLWPVPYWVELAGWLSSKGVEAGLLGAAAKTQRDAYHAEEADAALIRAGVQDLRGRLSLPEAAGALTQAAAFVTVDNG